PRGAPVDVDPARLSGYRVYAGDAPGNLTLLADADRGTLNLTDAPLPYGATRHYQVSAVAADGAEGERTPVRNATTVEPPGAPRNVTAKAGPGVIRVAWLPPATGDGPFGYRVFAATDAEGPYAWVGSTSETWLDHEGLPPGATRHYVVQALHQLEGPWSSPPAGATTPALPGAPANLTVAPGPRSLALSWSPPPLDGGSPVLSYRVYRGTNATNASWVATVNASGTSYEDAPLPDAATRHYRVSAVSAVGEGPLSASAAGTTYGPPGAPRDLAANATNASVALSWSAPVLANATSGYRVYRDGGLVAAVPASQLSWVDANAPRRANLTYVVRAANVAGEGPASNAAAAWLPDVPGAPRALSASGVSKVTLKWEAPADDGGAPLLKYRVWRAVGAGDMTLLAETPPSERSYVDRTCAVGVVCAYRVSAVNGAGEGPRSAEASRL
ncbi:MAG TPA: fibronectin type III domain-containing protein, partial [Candidatus Thermoplasmatota archaeon]|nr:fibronectin type III domain-containing protein [Candidatus Thermoplasmatota archaeon]